MPWLLSLIPSNDRLFITQEDHEALKKAYHEAVEKEHEKMFFKGKVVGIKDVFNALIKLDEERDWELTKKMAREAEEEL